MLRLFEYSENWNEIRKKVYRRDGWICQKCGIKNVRLYAHHLVPLSENGSDEIDNLITLCKRCHTDMHFGTKYRGILTLIMLLSVFLVNISPILFFIGLATILFVSIFGVIETNKARRELLERFRKI